MRNARRPSGRAGGSINRFARIVAACCVAVLSLVTSGGCAGGEDRAAAANARRSELAAGFAALEQRQYDEAIAAGDRVLKQDATGPGSAEALYLQGRALEQKAREAGSPAEARQFLRDARGVYARAVSMNPPQPLSAYARAGLANVSYFLEDYATAAREWEAAAEHVTEPDARAWVLYRAGLSRQRIGNFAEADRHFAQVRQEFPGTEQAKRAESHAGATSFHVQVGTFASRQNAEQAIGLLKAQGYSPARASDNAGRHVVAVGPVNTYNQAKALRDRLAGQYPGAKIVP